MVNFGKIPNLPKSLNESLELAFLNNPDLNKLRFELENSKIQIRSNTLNFFPEFSISGSFAKSMESSRTIERKDSFVNKTEIRNCLMHTNVIFSLASN